MNSRWVVWVVGWMILGMGGSGCVTHRAKPCSEGGQAARDGTEPFKGTKKCFQTRDSTGAYVNDGKYFEWHEDDSIAVVGQYKMGKKTGRWIEYDKKGKKTSDKHYEKGKEIDSPTGQ